ncbi:MAG: hypothetical protein ACTTJL_07805, partial [Hoylesella enoeca]
GYINLLDADNKAFDTLFHARVKSGAPAGSFDIKPLRAATNKARAERQLEALRKELDPLIRKFEEANGIAPNVLTFTGKTQGSGKKKFYELAYSTAPKRTLWVVREKDELKEVKE